MMTDTPRTDACIAENGDPVFKTSTGLAVLARQLERDLAEARRTRDWALSSLRSFDPKLADHIAAIGDRKC